MYKIARNLTLIIIALTLVIIFCKESHAIDWTNDPALTDTYTQTLTDIKDRDTRAIKMDYTGDSNIPTGTIRFNNTSDRIERYNGASWDSKLADYTSHLTNVANPHTVTHTQVGSATAQWNANKIQGYDVTVTSVADNELIAYDSASGDFINQTAAEAALATTASLSSHTSDATNPHSVTATQVSALAIANNLSDLASTSTARSNLGLGSLALLSSINNSHWSGPNLGVVNGGTGASNTVNARSNLGAAALGSNSDITALNSVTSISPATSLTIDSGALITLQSGSSSDRIFFGNATDGNIIALLSTSLSPTSARAANLGSTLLPYNGISGDTFNFVQTTSGTVGSLDGYINIQVNGSARKIPYYNP